MARSLAVPLFMLASPGLVESMTPVVIWHGMGDNCCLPFSMGHIKSEIEDAAKNIGDDVFVYSIMIGSNVIEDEFEGFFGNMNNQVTQVCNDLQKVPELQNGFNALGFSQGSQLMRAYVQRCNNPPVKQLITFGGQHMGVAEIPGCIGTNLPLCKQMAELLGMGAYAPGVRDVSIQAQYFRAPMEKDEYLSENIFLPDINNENADTRKESYKTNMISLERLVLIKFTEDFIVVPQESSWFSYYPWGTLDTSKIQAMNETQLYREDWIGLRTLDEAGKVVLKECPAMHMKFTMEYFRTEVLDPYLLPKSPSQKIGVVNV